MTDSNPPLPLPVIAILGGTGKEGPGLAQRWSTVGYKVIIGSRSADKARATAKEINDKLGIQTVTGMENAEAARLADICVLTVEQSAHQAALESLKEALQGKILVDTTAQVDFRNPLPPAPPAAARLAQDLLGPDVRVVAGFQTVPATSLKKNLGGSLDTDVLICSDDVQAAEEVIHLAQGGGMRAYYAGKLDNAIVVEGITSLLISINQHYGVRTASVAITGLQKS
jgi:NADPH-dependent F420 reductase